MMNPCLITHHYYFQKMVFFSVELVQESLAGGLAFQTCFWSFVKSQGTHLAQTFRNPRCSVVMVYTLPWLICISPPMPSPSMRSRMFSSVTLVRGCQLWLLFSTCSRPLNFLAQSKTWVFESVASPNRALSLVRISLGLMPSFLKNLMHNCRFDM